jgi:hypothetical protein
MIVSLKTNRDIHWKQILKKIPYCLKKIHVSNSVLLVKTIIAEAMFINEEQVRLGFPQESYFLSLFCQNVKIWNRKYIGNGGLCL